jgi:hypothetical protein
MMNGPTWREAIRVDRANGLTPLFGRQIATPEHFVLGLFEIDRVLVSSAARLPPTIPVLPAISATRLLVSPAVLPTADFSAFDSLIAFVFIGLY